MLTMLIPMAPLRCRDCLLRFWVPARSLTRMLLFGAQLAVLAALLTFFLTAT